MCSARWGSPRLFASPPLHRKAKLTNSVAHNVSRCIESSATDRRNVDITMSSKGNAAQTGAILPTFFYYMFASMLGLLAITTTSLIDGMFVGNYVGGNALASITLLLPCLT